MYKTQSNTNQQQRENQRENPKQQTHVKNEGFITKDFHFEKQKESADQILQKPRSQEYLVALEMVDYLTSKDEEIIERLRESMGDEFVEELQEMTDEEINEMIAEAFAEEFEEVEDEGEDELQAVLSECYISGCDCHALDSHGFFLDHYKTYDKLSEDLELGRKIFRQHKEKCLCVEVYKRCCRVISITGDVQVIDK